MTREDIVDCVARQDVERYIEGFINEYTPKEELEFINLELDGLKHIPSVTPQEPLTPKWCTDCREYDQEKHCCHRWSRAIRDTVEEMKQYYIEREVLDKMIEEILSRMWNCKGKHTTSIDKVKMEILIREIIHKYCDKEQTDGNDD